MCEELGVQELQPHHHPGQSTSTTVQASGWLLWISKQGNMICLTQLLVYLFYVFTLILQILIN